VIDCRNRWKDRGWWYGIKMEGFKTEGYDVGLRWKDLKLKDTMRD
jgi:hypothetical protein